MATQRYRVGVDIGGTFTDLVFIGDNGTVTSLKVASTPDDFSRAVLEGVATGAAQLGVSPEAIDQFGHGFTIATNAILEEKGAHTALITTSGFRDVLEFRRNRVPRLYDLYYKKPPAVVKRQYRFEVTERMNFRGEVLTPLDENDVERVIDKIIAAKVESVAICLIHAYANPDHEQRIAAALRRRAPDMIVTLSSELLPIMREYERTSTTVINAYVRPVVERYLKRLGDGLDALNVRVPVSVMQSNGGLATTRMASERPAFCIESGPAAGVMGAYNIGKSLGLDNLMTIDMGGTTAKATIIEGGEVLYSQEYEVGAGLNVGHRLLRGAGHIISLPAIDLAEVGAGGGSIASVDSSGGLRVGPHSAGAAPGPACYGRGGTDATVTDANVLLGYLHPKHLLGGKFPLHYDKAQAAMRKHVGEPLGLSEIEAAYGVHMVANSNMNRALVAVSSERGRDPRRFALMAFGGGGPVHAAGLAQALGIKHIVVPLYPGVFSAFGLLCSEVEHHIAKTHFKNFADLDLASLNAMVDGLRDEARRVLTAENFPAKRQELEIQVEMKYAGQGGALTVKLPAGKITAATLKQLMKAYDAEHEKTFGHTSNNPYQLVNIRVVARGLSERGRTPSIKNGAKAGTKAAAKGKQAAAKRKAYFGPEKGWIDTPIIGRDQLTKTPRLGPLLIEEYDSTCVVPPGWRVAIDARRNIILTMK